MRCRIVDVGGAISGPAEVTLYRPSDRTLDRSVAWHVPTEPLVLDLPAAGLWQLRVRVPLAAGPAVVQQVVMR